MNFLNFHAGIYLFNTCGNATYTKRYIPKCYNQKENVKQLKFLVATPFYPLMNTYKRLSEIFQPGSFTSTLLLLKQIHITFFTLEQSFWKYIFILPKL